MIDNGLRWRVKYAPKDNVDRRGGDLVIEVDGGDGSIKKGASGAVASIGWSNLGVNNGAQTNASAAARLSQRG
jgi:hypothetical protein